MFRRLFLCVCLTSAAISPLTAFPSPAGLPAGIGAPDPQPIVSPQIAVGGAFTTRVNVQNSGNLSCEVRASLGGLNEVPGGLVLIDGRASGASATIPPLGRHTFRLELQADNPNAQVQGGIVIQTVTRACEGFLAVSTDYLLRQGAQLQEAFSYDQPAPIFPGSCALGAVDFGLRADGITNSTPGLALQASEDIPAGSLCMQLSDAEGIPITSNQCDPFDGRHLVGLLPDFFQSNRSFSGTWKVCNNTSRDAGPEPIPVFALFINVLTQGSEVQLAAAPASVGGAECMPDGRSVCLNGGRFLAQANWSAPGSTIVNEASSAGLREDGSGRFIFSSENQEILVKMFDGCRFNDRYWVFSASTTDIDYTLRIIDTQTGTLSNFSNDLGGPSPAIIDTDAFATCP